ncbi:unnamed protein product [Closterium sp. NIES-54]
MARRPSSVPLRVPLPPPPQSSLHAVPDPESDLARAATPTVSRLLATVFTDPFFESAAASALVAELVEFAVACRLNYATALVGESESVCPPSVGGECTLSTDILEDTQEDFECLATAVPRFASMLLAPEGDSDAPEIPTLRSYTEAITGPYPSQWQAAMDAEMASWKSTSTYVDAVPPSRANIVDGMWIFRVKRPPGSPPVFKACYVARGFSQRQGVDYFQTFSHTPKMTNLWVFLHFAAQRDYELHSLDFSTSFLQGSLNEEIWMRRPPGFTGSFPAGTHCSLRRPVYGLCQAPRECHDTLRTTLAALGFAPSTADPSLFLRTDMLLPLFYVFVYVGDLVFATADTEALTLVKSELQKRLTCTDLGELRSCLGLQITRDRARRNITLTQSHMVHQVLQRFGFQLSLPQPTPLSTGHSLSPPPSDEFVELSGSYPKLVGCLMYLMTCTRPDLAYPLSLLARYVAPGRHRKVHWDAAKRVLRYLCSTSGMGLVLGGRGPVVLTSHADASWAEIYVWAMAAQELRWLTYLLTDLGEKPCSFPALYVDNKAMIALCQEHRTKHIALQYFLARELQQRGQLRLAYVATRANTADKFTKALPPGDHQRFSTVLGLVPTLPHLLTIGELVEKKVAARVLSTGEQQTGRSTREVSNSAGGEQSVYWSKQLVDDVAVDKEGELSAGEESTDSDVVEVPVKKSELRRTGRTGKPPERLVFHDIATMTVKEVLTSWKDEAVKVAMEEKIRSLIDIGTWELVERPCGVNIKKNRWVLTTKYCINDTIEREKARLVVKGFTQVHGADYCKTYSPMSSYVRLRIFLNIVAVLDLNLMQLDMKNVFLQSKLDRVLYMYQPDYFDDGTGRVDDLLAASSSTTMLKELKKLLEAAFKLREILPVVKYLGLEIVCNRRARNLWLYQRNYVDNLRRRFIDEEQGGRISKTPVSVDAYAELTFEYDEAEERKEEEYRQKVGSLQFTATTTRPDIAFAYSKLGSDLIMRSSQHWREVDHCLAYLADTHDTTPEFGGGPESLELIGYIDVDDAGDKQNQTRTGGYVFVFGGAAVSWSSQRIKCATLSSTESEYIAATDAGKEGRRLRFLLAEFKLLDAEKPTILRMENKLAITIAEGLGLTGNLKHMERHYAWLQHMVRRGKFVLKYISTTEQPADFLTKALHFPAFNRCSVAIGQVRLVDVGDGNDDVQQ